MQRYLVPTEACSQLPGLVKFVALLPPGRPSAQQPSLTGGRAPTGERREEQLGARTKPAGNFRYPGPGRSPPATQGREARGGAGTGGAPRGGREGAPRVPPDRSAGLGGGGAAGRRTPTAAPGRAGAAGACRPVAAAIASPRRPSLRSDKSPAGSVPRAAAVQGHGAGRPH